MKIGTQTNTTTCRIESPFGTFHATFSDKGLASLKFPHQTEETAFSSADTTSGSLTKQTASVLLAVLKGQSIGELPPLDLQGTDFQKAVWKTLASIPKGQTMTYGEIAAAIGRPKAFRAVGQACGANPIPVLIPCHRALAADKKIGGFSGGMEWKERLLGIEDCSFHQPKAAQRP